MRQIKSQDIVVLLKLCAQRLPGPSSHLSSASRKSGLAGALERLLSQTTYDKLSESLSIDKGTLHASLTWAAKAKLYDFDLRQPIRSNLLEFLIHGLKFCFPVQPGETTRGIPTSSWASPLVSKFAPGAGTPLVWPYPEGQVVGRAFEPIHRAVPVAAQRDEALKELLVLVDAIREGNPRVVSVAVEELKARLEG